MKYALLIGAVLLMTAIHEILPPGLLGVLIALIAYPTIFVVALVMIAKEDEKDTWGQ